MAITSVLKETNDEEELEVNIADSDYENITNLTPTGVPPHKLRVCVGAVMMIIVNIDVSAGLCNGTRFLLLRNLNVIFLEFKFWE